LIVGTGEREDIKQILLIRSLFTYNSTSLKLIIGDYSGLKNKGIKEPAAQRAEYI